MLLPFFMEDNLKIFEEKKILGEGSIKLMNCMPHPATLITPEQAIVDAARVSYSHGTVKKRTDNALIGYLMRHWHTSVFEQVELQFRVTAPMYVFRQWHRHRTQSYNEISGRYSVILDNFELPALERFRHQDSNNKQSSSDSLIDEPETARSLMEASFNSSYVNYEKLIELGVSREVARSVLPAATYTTCYAKGNLLNWFKFCLLRSDSHAQEEIRLYSCAIEDIIAEYAPVAYDAFVKYWKNSISYSTEELRIISYLLNNSDLTNQLLEANDSSDGFLGKLDLSMSAGEFKEFRNKILETIQK